MPLWIAICIAVFLGISLVWMTVFAVWFFEELKERKIKPRLISLLSPTRLAEKAADRIERRKDGR